MNRHCVVFCGFCGDFESFESLVNFGLLFIFSSSLCLRFRFFFFFYCLFILGRSFSFLILCFKVSVWIPPCYFCSMFQ